MRLINYTDTTYFIRIKVLSFHQTKDNLKMSESLPNLSFYIKFILLKYVEIRKVSSF